MGPRDQGSALDLLAVAKPRGSWGLSSSAIKWERWVRSCLRIPMAAWDSPEGHSQRGGLGGAGKVGCRVVGLFLSPVILPPRPSPLGLNAGVATSLAG